MTRSIMHGLSMAIGTRVHDQNRKYTREGKRENDHTGEVLYMWQSYCRQVEYICAAQGEGDSREDNL